MPSRQPLRTELGALSLRASGERLRRQLGVVAGGSPPLVDLEESRPRRLIVRARERAGKAVLRKKHILTIPRDVVDRMHLEEGDEFIVTEEEGRIVLTPALSIPADQAWFWTPEWQARIAEAEADRVHGNSTVYRSEEEFLASLGDS
jgi:antitoxin PrlF